MYCSKQGKSNGGERGADETEGTAEKRKESKQERHGSKWER